MVSQIKRIIVGIQTAALPRQLAAPVAVRADFIVVYFFVANGHISTSCQTVLGVCEVHDC